MSANPRVPAGRSDGDLRHVLERFDVGVVVRRMEAGFAHLPAYTSFFWPVDRGAVVRWNVELLLRWMTSGTPPDTSVRSELYEFLRARAAAGQPIEDSILVYRRGARLLWEALLDLGTDAERAVLTALSDAVWSCIEDYLDLVVDVFAQAYADHEDAPSTAGDRRARALFDRLCAAAGHDRGPGPGRPARLRSGGAVGPVRRAAGRGSVAAHASLASRLRAARALAFTEGVRIAGLTPPGFGWDEFLTDPRLLLAQDPPTARGNLGAASEGLHALVAIAVGSGRRGRVRAEEFLPELLLANSPDVAGRIAQRVFGPLEGADSPGLTDTLRALAASGFDTAVAAAALPVHRNTLLYRTARVEKLTGLSLKDQRDRTLVLLAVTWQAIAGDIGPAAPGGAP